MLCRAYLPNNSVLTALRARFQVGSDEADLQLTGSFCKAMLLDSYSVQSENLFLTYSCCQKVDYFLNGVISFAIRGLQFAVYRECWVWFSVKQAVCQRATDTLVEKDKHQSHFQPLVGKPVKIASALALQQGMGFHFA